MRGSSLDAIIAAYEGKTIARLHSERDPGPYSFEYGNRGRPDHRCHVVGAYPREPSEGLI